MTRVPTKSSNAKIQNIWQSQDWTYFRPEEFACRHCGELYIWPEFLDRLTVARKRIGKPFHILSGHRCSLHNARIGGAPLSQHLKLAADISLIGHDRTRLYKSCLDAGFRGFGFYHSFLHIDLGRARHWFGSKNTRSQWRI